MSRIDHLVSGRHYAVARAFSDFDRVAHAVGEVFRFESRSFVPYDDGHLLRFTDPNGQTWSMRMRDTPDEQGPLLAELDQVFRAQSEQVAPAGPPRDAAALLARARIAAAVYGVATGFPHDGFEELLDELSLHASLTPQEEGWLTGRVEAPSDATWQVDQALALAWALGLLDGFRDVSEEDSAELCQALLLETPTPRLREPAVLREQLAWCAALREFRAMGLPVWSALDARALWHHRNALAWALGAPLEVWSG